MIHLPRKPALWLLRLSAKLFFAMVGSSSPTHRTAPKPPCPFVCLIIGVGLQLFVAMTRLAPMLPKSPWMAKPLYPITGQAVKLSFRDARFEALLVWFGMTQLLLPSVVNRWPLLFIS